MRSKKLQRTGTIRIQLVFLMCLLVTLGWTLFALPAMNSISLLAFGLLVTLLVLFTSAFLVLHEFPETLGTDDEKIATRQ